MNANQWMAVVEEAFQAEGQQLSEQLRNLLFEDAQREDEKFHIAVEATNMVQRLFWQRVQHGKTFGDPARCVRRLGDTVEGVYGLSSGPFIDLARTYWTYETELDDLKPDWTDKWRFHALLAVVYNLRALFFPSPGPLVAPASVRRREQIKYLRKYAPNWDIERFIAESPILSADRSRVGCAVAILVSVTTGAIALMGLTMAATWP